MFTNTPLHLRISPPPPSPIVVSAMISYAKTVEMYISDFLGQDEIGIDPEVLKDWFYLVGQLRAWCDEQYAWNRVTETSESILETLMWSDRVLQFEDMTRMRGF